MTLMTLGLFMDSVIIRARNLFEKLPNAIFFKLFKIPSNGQLVQVPNLTKIFFEKICQQIWSLEWLEVLLH